MRGPAPARKLPWAALAPRGTRFATRSAFPFVPFQPYQEEVQSGPGANAETQALARRVAEAQIDLRRLRFARHQFLSDTLSNEYYGSYANLRKKLKVLHALLQPNPPDMSSETLEFANLDTARAGQARDDPIGIGEKVTGHGSL